jgi:hypothetical protein
MQPRSDSERIAYIEATVMNIEKRLFGNGQPGEIDQLHERLNGHGKRLAKMENWKWWLLGIGLGIGLGSGVGIVKILEAAGR